MVESYEERRRRQTENARERQHLPPSPAPMSALDAGAEAAKQVKLIPDVPQGMQGGGDLAAKIEKLTQDVAEILTIVRSIQGNPPYAMLG